MVCEHLSQLEAELLAAGVTETFLGTAWSDNCLEWVYFDCLLDRDSIRRRIEFPAFVAEAIACQCPITSTITRTSTKASTN